MASGADHEKLFLAGVLVLDKAYGVAPGVLDVGFVSSVLQRRQPHLHVSSVT